MEGTKSFSKILEALQNDQIFAERSEFEKHAIETLDLEVRVSF